MVSVVLLDVVDVVDVVDDVYVQPRFGLLAAAAAVPGMSRAAPSQHDRSEPAKPTDPSRPLSGPPEFLWVCPSVPEWVG